MVIGSYADLKRCAEAWVEATGISLKKAIFYCQLGKYPVEGEPIIEEMKAKGESVSPLPFATLPVSNGISMDQILIFFAIVKLAKTPEGLKVLRDIAVALIKALDRSSVALAKASVGNPVSAWGNPYLLSILWERFGLVPHDRMAEFRIGLSVVSGIEVAEDAISAIASIFKPFVKPPPSEFPQQIHFGDETYVIQPPKIEYRPEKKEKKKK